MSWRTTRLQILDRDNWLCVECNSPIKGRNAHVHHKLPKALGGADTADNLISLCSRCHSLKHMNLQASLGRRFIEKVAVRVARFFDHSNLENIDGGQLGLALRYLNVKRLRAGQLQPILSALAGKSVLFISPTGSGKSLCFQLPALVHTRNSIVISPLKALMSDQVGGLLNREFPATFINSDLPKAERETRLNLIKKNKFKLIYMAPERLEPSRNRASEQQIIFKNSPAYLIIDEAHCIDKWGDAFRPSYTKIGEARQSMGNPRVLAFTATAGRKTRSRILENLNAQNAEVFVEGVDRPNVALMRFKAEDLSKRAIIVQRLFERMRFRSAGKALIFVPTIKKGNEVLNLLKEAGLNVDFFHGKLPPQDRDFLLGRFEGRLESKLDLLICTNAFGMGMDIPNIRIVFHWQHPGSPEDYLQEFGRAGRDGKQSLAVLFTKSDDTRLHKFMLNKSLDKAEVDQSTKQQIFDAKTESIQLINDMAHASNECFSTRLKNELDTDGSGRKGISRFILDWVFTERSKQTKRRFCCDGCYRKNNKGPVSNFAESVVDRMN